MLRHRCYVTLLSLSVLFFFLVMHTHLLHTMYVGKKKKRERERREKKTTLPIGQQPCLLSTRRLYTLSMCVLIVLSIVSRRVKLGNDHVYSKSILRS